MIWTSHKYCQKILSFLVIALVVTFAAAARRLDEEDTSLGTTITGSASTAGSGAFPGPFPASGSGSTGGGFGAGTGSIPSSGAGSTGTGFGAGTGSIPSSGSGPLPKSGPGALLTAGSVPGPLGVGNSGSLPATGPGPLPAGGSGALPAGGSASGTGPGVGAGAGPALGGGAGPAVGGGAGPAAGGGAGPAVGGGAGPAAGGGAGPAAGGGAASAAGGGGAGPAVGGVGAGLEHPLVFFMHDILGGSNPTARAVTGVVANPALSGQLPFPKPNGANLPLSNGVSSNNNNVGIVNNDNVPFLVGLSGTTANILQSGDNGNSNLLNGLPAAASGGQLPSGSALQMLMFGTMTVIDDELTEGHELGSGLLGKAQGYYVASAIDGTSQTMAFTAMFESGGYEDSISFFGVHRTAVSESHLGIMGGTGKYVNARGFAIVKTFTGSNGSQQEQPHRFTDGFETVLEVTVYLSY